MDSKKIIEKLVSIAQQQQKIIHKLAQQLPPDSVPSSGTTFTPGKTGTPPAPPPPDPNKPATQTHTDQTHTEAKAIKAIIEALPPAIKNHLVTLEVHDGTVKVRFKSPVSDAVFNAVTNTVQKLQEQNVLPPKNYKVIEA
jgi:hypothetical protein